MRPPWPTLPIGVSRGPAQRSDGHENLHAPCMSTGGKSSAEVTRANGRAPASAACLIDSASRSVHVPHTARHLRGALDGTRWSPRCLRWSAPRSRRTNVTALPPCVRPESMRGTLCFAEDVDPWEWRESAPCRSFDVSLFFDGPFDGAKELCRSCPVLETCGRGTITRRQESRRAIGWVSTPPRRLESADDAAGPHNR
jgi:hypothetical protein